MLKLRNGYSIQSDSLEFTLRQEQKENKKGEKVYKIIGHYTSIENAIIAYSTLKLREKINEKDNNVSEFIKEFKQLKQEIRDEFNLRSE